MLLRNVMFFRGSTIQNHWKEKKAINRTEKVVLEMCDLRKPNILIASGSSDLSYPGLKNLVEILTPLTQEMFMILGDEKQLRLVSFGSNFKYHIMESVNLPSNRVIRFILVYVLPVVLFLKIREKIDVILGYGLYGSSEHGLMMLVAKVLRKKLLYFIDGSSRGHIKFVPYSATDLLQKLGFFVCVKEALLRLKYVDKVVLITSRLAIEYKKHKSKIMVGYNFPSADFYSNFNIKKKYSGRPLTIGYVGGFRLIKGVHLLANAVPEILLQMPNLEILFMGDLSHAEPPNLGQIIKNELHSYKNVVFTGYVPYNELPKYLNKLRLLILPSFSEGFPAVVLEAMACGTPVLATPIGAISDIIKDSETGFLLKSNDSVHIADRIEELLDNPKLLEKVSGNAYNYIRLNFSFEKTLEGWRKIFEQLEITN